MIILVCRRAGVLGFLAVIQVMDDNEPDYGATFHINNKALTFNN